MSHHDSVHLTRRAALKRGVIATGALLIGGATTSGTAAAGIGDGRVADFHLNNIRPDGTVKDSSPEKNHGAAHTAQVVKDGAVGNALKFDGDGYVHIESDESLQVENVTVAGWVRRNGQKSREYIFDGANHNYWIKENDNEETIRFGVGVDGNWIRVNSPDSLSDGVWTHVAGTYDGDVAKLYINGGEPVDTNDDGSGAIDKSSGPSRIGDYIQGGYGYQGSIDEVRVYNRALSGQEILDLVDQPYDLSPFLNAEAEWKDQPIWEDGITDQTGQSSVGVDVGVLTSLDVPEDALPEGVSPPPAGPFAFDPMVVKVSPGTDVTWTWQSEHHSVTNFVPGASGPSDPESDPTDTGGHGTLFDDHGHEPPHTFTYTFDDPGIYPYFCHPHGTPYPAYDGFLDSLGVDPIRENLFGMRGAVIVE